MFLLSLATSLHDYDGGFSSRFESSPLIPKGMKNERHALSSVSGSKASTLTRSFRVSRLNGIFTVRKSRNIFTEEFGVMLTQADRSQQARSS